MKTGDTAMNKPPTTNKHTELPICDGNLRILYKNGTPEGIRDRGGFLFFFPTVTKFQGQEERYKREVSQQDRLADYLLGALTNFNPLIKQRDELLEMLESTLSWLTSYPGGGAINKYDQARNLINKIDGEK